MMASKQPNDIIVLVPWLVPRCVALPNDQQLTIMFSWIGGGGFEKIDAAGLYLGCQNHSVVVMTKRDTPQHRNIACHMFLFNGKKYSIAPKDVIVVGWHINDVEN